MKHGGNPERRERERVGKGDGHKHATHHGRPASTLSSERDKLPASSVLQSEKTFLGGKGAGATGRFFFRRRRGRHGSAPATSFDDVERRRQFCFPT
jgi:hypothetical protein